jgi:type I restriction enzyme, S subunit
MTYERVTLRDVVEPRPGTRNPSAGGVPEFSYVDLDAVDREMKAITAPKQLAADAAPSRARKIIRARDVLVALVRPNLNAIALVPPDLDNAIASTGFCVLRATERILPEYLFYFARSQRFVASLCGLVSGAMYPAVTEGQVLNQKVTLPPVAEQRRIVDLLSRAENIVRMRRQAEATAKEIIPALFLDMFGDPARNERGWEAKPLSDLVRFVSGGTPSKSRTEYWQGLLPWVSPKDMKMPEILDAEDHISDQVPIQTSIKLIPLDAVLIVVRGMILVHTAPVAITRVPVTINQDMKALLVGSRVNADYLMWLLRISQGWLLSLVSTAAHGTRKIDTARLEALRIPVPPRELQEKFVRRVRALIGVTSSQSHATQIAEHTFQSLLAGVFGEGAK